MASRYPTKTVRQNPRADDNTYISNYARAKVYRSRHARPILSRRHPLECAMQVYSMGIPQLRPANTPRCVLSRHHRLRLHSKWILEGDKPRFYEAPPLRVEPPSRKEPCRIGRDVYGSSDLVVHARALVDVDDMSGTTEGDGCGQSRDAGTDDQNVQHDGKEALSFLNEGFACKAAGRLLCAPSPASRCFVLKGQRVTYTSVQTRTRLGYPRH